MKFLLAILVVMSALPVFAGSINCEGKGLVNGVQKNISVTAEKLGINQDVNLVLSPSNPRMGLSSSIRVLKITQSGPSYPVYYLKAFDDRRPVDGDRLDLTIEWRTNGFVNLGQANLKLVSTSARLQKKTVKNYAVKCTLN